jgi:Endosomal/lysosomal potassium channel TMEM175
VRKLPDRVWRLPRQEDDEAAEEGIGRILALSDGVFAIAVTLLILDIAVPATTSDDDLAKALLDLWPRYLAYALSFLVIARFWVIHHQTFRLIVRDNAVLVWLNFLLLLFIAFLPFPTAVLGSHEGSPAAAVLYATAVCLSSGPSHHRRLCCPAAQPVLRPPPTPTRPAIHFPVQPVIGHHAPVTQSAGHRAGEGLPSSRRHHRYVPRPIRRGVPHGCASRLFAASMAFAPISRGSALPDPPNGRLSNDAAGFASCYGPHRRSPQRGF